MSLVFATCRYGDLTLARRGAIGVLLGPRYRAMTYPTTEGLFAALGVGPDDPSFAARLADLDGRIAAAQDAHNDNHAVSLLIATGLGGREVVVAVMRTIYGALPVALTARIGEPTSSLPTHRIFRFLYPPDLPFDPAATGEDRLAEWGRVVVANNTQLQPHLANGTLTGDEASYVVRHGFDAMLAGSYYRDRALAAPPLGYIYNGKPRLTNALREGKGFSIASLYRDGAEPTEAILDQSPFFRRWKPVLEEVVPAEVLARGLAAAVRHLVGSGFTDWRRLALNLPELILCDGATDRAIARLAAQAQLPTRHVAHWPIELAGVATLAD